MRSKLPILAIGLVALGCGGGPAGTEARLIEPVTKPDLVAKAATPVHVKELPYLGQNLIVDDPSNADFTGVPCKFPKMPLEPLSRGPLDNSVFVIDPGHGGEDPGAYWIENIKGRNTAFWESAYSYPLAYSLADKLRERGATVYLTAYSEASKVAAENQANADDPLPVPRDAALAWNGKSVQPGKIGWWQRINMSNDVYQRLHKDKKVVMVSVHVDAMPSHGWKGSHVLVKDKENPPAIARDLAHKLIEGGYARTEYGELRPVIDRTRDLFIFRKTNNPDTILWETALPQDPEDSARIRDKATREQFTDLMVEAATEYIQG
jgi:N-acetylmuramoyl-L-alanine amidase